MTDSTTICVPQEIANDDSVRVVSLYVTDGQSVQAGERIAEIETSKSNVEITSPGAGSIELCCTVGSDILIGGTLAKLHPAEKMPRVVEAPMDGQPSSSPVKTIFSAAAKTQMQSQGLDPAAFQQRTFVRTKDLAPAPAVPTPAASAAPFQQTLGEDWSWWRLLKADLFRIDGVDDRAFFFRQWWCNPGFRYLCWFRIAQAARATGGIARVLYYFALWRMNVCGSRSCIRLPVSVKAGPGLMIGHANSIWINGRCTFGANCTLGNDINIGESGGSGSRGVPQFGDATFVGPGARLSGDIHIAQESAIMANTVIATSLPTGSIAIGVPGRVTGHHAHNRFVSNRIQF